MALRRGGKGSLSDACEIFRCTLSAANVISHKYKCIFVEVPMTGSTSIRAILGKAWKPHQNLCQIKQLMETSWTLYGGITKRIMAGLYLLLPDERRRKAGRNQFENYFKFGFVRNQ